jgi:hypothetical protein
LQKCRRNQPVKGLIMDDEGALAPLMLRGSGSGRTLNNKARCGVSEMLAPGSHCAYRSDENCKLCVGTANRLLKGVDGGAKIKSIVAPNVVYIGNSSGLGRSSARGGVSHAWEGL